MPAADIREDAFGAEDVGLTEDELELRRAERASIAQRVAEGELEEEDDGQFSLGVVEGDGALSSARDLIKRGLPIRQTVSVMSASVPLRGMIDPEAQGQLLVAYVPRKYELVPDRDGDRVVGWELRVQVRPVYVQTAPVE
jgi:hypothetical protein